jgi:phage protein D
MSDLFVSVTVAGEELTDLVERVEVEERDDRADLAVVTFGDSGLVLADLLCEGLGVEVALGRTDSHAVMLRGTVTAIRSHLPSRGRPEVEIEAVDRLIGLGLVPKTRRWWNTTIGQVVREIAIGNGLLPGSIQPGLDATVTAARPLQQVEETDLALLHRLARTYDAKVWVEHQPAADTLDFVATSRLLQSEPVEERLVFNANLLHLTAAFDAHATDPARRLVAADPDSGARVEVIGSPVTAPDWTPDPERLARLGDGAARAGRLLARTAATRARLTESWRRQPREAGAASRPASDRAGVLGDPARRLGQTGRGRAAGSIWLRPRRRVRVEGCGGRWSGTWYLGRVRHELDVRGRSYITSFEARR